MGQPSVDGLIDAETERWNRGQADEDKERLERLAFVRLSYEEKLAICARPEEIDGPTEAGWKAINTHLGTRASTLPELFDQLSV